MAIRFAKADATQKRLVLYVEDSSTGAEYKFVERYDKSGRGYADLTKTKVTCYKKFLVNWKVFCLPRVKRGLNNKYEEGRSQLDTILRGAAEMAGSLHHSSLEVKKEGQDSFWQWVVRKFKQQFVDILENEDGSVTVAARSDGLMWRYEFGGYLFKKMEARCRLKDNNVCEEGASLFLKVSKDGEDAKVAFHSVTSPLLLQKIGAIIAAGLGRL